MPLFLDTRGKSTLGIGICARCSCKFPLEELLPDPNYTGLRVCRDDLDRFDPWRLPAPPADRITLTHPRPDSNLFPFVPIPVYANQINGVSSVLPTTPWAPNRPYQKGASITPLDANDLRVDLPQHEFVALNSGVSGASPPVWPNHTSVIALDNGIAWQCIGIFLLDGTGYQNNLPLDNLYESFASPPPIPLPAFETGFYSNGGELTLDGTFAWPIAAHVPGAVYSDGEVCAVVPGVVPNPLAPPVYFGGITAIQLLALGGGDLPLVQPAPGSGQLWNNGGVISIA